MQQPVSREAEEAIREILAGRLGPLGYEGARIEPGLDHDGDPVLFIHVDYKLLDKPIDVSPMAGLVSELRRALVAIGEERFPHVKHRFDERQQVAALS